MLLFCLRLFPLYTSEISPHGWCSSFGAIIAICFVDKFFPGGHLNYMILGESRPPSGNSLLFSHNGYR